MDFAKYLTYSLSDFLEDDYFINGVISPDEEHDQYWNAFRAEFPLQAQIADKASQIIKAYRQQEVFTNAERRDIVWQRIETTLQRNTKARVFKLPALLKVAAIILMVFSIGFAYHAYQNRIINVKTVYGEVKKITLPDNSTVILNGNSNLSYVNNWGTGIRQVWVDGEAYFKVKHINKDVNRIKTSERFVVHCADMNVEVLGTEFNVRQRRHKTNVGLISGKIRLDYLVTNPGISKSLIMQPGDFVEYSNKKTAPIKKLINPVRIIKWTNHQFVFNDIRLADIVETLQDDYGFSIKLSDQSMAELKIEGEINVSSVKELLETITTTLHVNVYQNDNSITIYSIKP